MGLSTNSAPNPIPQYESTGELAKELANNPTQVKGLSQQAAATAAKVETLQLPDCITPETYKDLKSRIKTLNESVLDGLGTKNWGRWLSLGLIVGGVVPLVTSVIDWFRTRSLKQQLEKIEITKPEDYDALLGKADLDTLSKNKLRMMKGALLLENGKYAEADRLFEEVRKDLDGNITAHSFDRKSASPVLCHYLAKAKAGCGDYVGAFHFCVRAVERADSPEERAFFREETAKILYDGLMAKDTGVYKTVLDQWQWTERTAIIDCKNLVSEKLAKELQTAPFNQRRLDLVKALLALNFKSRVYNLCSEPYGPARRYMDDKAAVKIKKFIINHAASHPPETLFDANYMHVLMEEFCNQVKPSKWDTDFDNNVGTAYAHFSNNSWYSEFLDSKPPPSSSAVDLLILTSRDYFPLSWINLNPVNKASDLCPDLPALHKAIELGSGAAQYVLGTYYLTGCVGIPKNLKAAEECFQKAIKSGFKAAYQPAAAAAMAQGNTQRSIEILREGVAQKDALSSLNLALFGLNSRQEINKLVNPQEAVQYLHQAIEQARQDKHSDSLTSLLPEGHTSALRQIGLAAITYPELADDLKLNQYLGNDAAQLMEKAHADLTYYRGNRGTKFALYLAAFQAGDKTALSFAAHVLEEYLRDLRMDAVNLEIYQNIPLTGKMLDFHKKILHTIISYHIKQAQLGYNASLGDLFKIYSEGSLVTSDWVRALAWLKQGADIGDVGLKELFAGWTLKYSELRQQVDKMAEEFQKGENLYHDGFDRKVLEKGVLPPPSPSPKQEVVSAAVFPAPTASTGPASALPSAPEAEPMPAEDV